MEEQQFSLGGRGLGRFLAPPFPSPPRIYPDELHYTDLLPATTLHGHIVRGFMGILHKIEVGLDLAKGVIEVGQMMWDPHSE